jgi:hypothetical protein
MAADIFKDFGPGRQMAALVRRWGQGRPVGSGSLDEYLGSRGTDMGEELYGALGKKGLPSDEDLANDPLYQLDLASADARYGGDGGVSGRVSKAMSENAYGGPSIESLRAYGREGDTKIANLYSALNQYIEGQGQQTAQLYNQGTQAITGAYDKGAQDIAAAQAASTGALQKQAQLGSVGAQTAAPSQAQVSEAIQRQAALLATNKANALSSQTQMSEGQQAINKNFGTGAQVEKNAQTSKWDTQVNSLIAKAMQEMAAANARQAAAVSAAKASGGNQAGKNAAARNDALKNAIKRAQSGKDEKFTGVVGALKYALKQGKPEVAKKFLDILHSSSITASQQNERAKAEKLDPSLIQKDASGKSIFTVPTTAAEQLQLALGNAGPKYIDLANADPRGKDLMEMAKIPELSWLKNYMISNPEQARRQGQYQAAFGMSEKDYRNKGPAPGSNIYQREMASQARGPNQGLLQLPMKAWHGIFGGGGGPSGQDRTKFENEMNQRFTPFINLDALRRNTSDVNQFYDYFRNNNSQDLLATLYDIYSGKYGIGG